MGAEFLTDDTVSVRVWAPKRKRLELFVFDEGCLREEPSEPMTVDKLPASRRRVKLEREAGGYFSATTQTV